MSQHAKLSPSASERWLQCPASVRMEKEIPAYLRDVPSPYAQEGTKAHALGELEGRRAFGKISEEQYLTEYRAWLQTDPQLSTDELYDMENHVRDYVSLVQERAARHPHSEVLFEQRMPTGIRGCWGTSDTVIFSPVHVEIIDLKYGKGVAVAAEGNPQLRLYGLGALDSYGDILGDTETVYITVHQPRLYSVSTEEISADDLRAWREEIRPIAEDALAGSDRFGPSESACRWCPAAGICQARVDKMLEEDFGSDPDIISAEQLGELLTRIPDIRNWCDAMETAALQKIYTGGENIPGWKVVMSGGKRSIKDPIAAIQKLTEAGYAEDAVSVRKVQTLGALEKLVGRRELPDLLGDLLAKGEGKPSLAPEDDKRPAIDPNTEAARDFSGDV